MYLPCSYELVLWRVYDRAKGPKQDTGGARGDAHRVHNNIHAVYHIARSQIAKVPALRVEAEGALTLFHRFHDDVRRLTCVTGNS